MLDLLANAVKLDEFLIALLGHVANEASAKVTVSAVKAIGLAILGFAFEIRGKRQAAQSIPQRYRRQNKRRRKSVRLRKVRQSRFQTKSSE